MARNDREVTAGLFPDAGRGLAYPRPSLWAQRQDRRSARIALSDAEEPA